MLKKLSPLFTLVVLALAGVAGCASRSAPTPGERSTASMLDDERFASLGGPETSNFADVRRIFTPAEITVLHEHIGDVENYVNRALQKGSVSAAWIAGYFRMESSLPMLRQCLLSDRYFYGWEGPDPQDESSYLLDEQYTHHLAYIAAIEAITGKWIQESVILTDDDDEVQQLKAEANVDFAKRDVEPERVERGLCARWLLRKLTPPASLTQPSACR